MKKGTSMIIIFLWVFHGFGQNLHVFLEVEGVKHPKGKLIVAVFITQADFDLEKPYYEKIFQKTEVENGRVTLKIDLPPGTYGITVLDDVDGDRKMKYNYFGIPREGFGIANLETSGFRKPKFSEFSFLLNQKDEWKPVKMRYIF